MAKRKHKIVVTITTDKYISEKDATNIVRELCHVGQMDRGHLFESKWNGLVVLQKIQYSVYSRVVAYYKAIINGMYV